MREEAYNTWLETFNQEALKTVSLQRLLILWMSFRTKNPNLFGPENEGPEERQEIAEGMAQFLADSTS